MFRRLVRLRCSAASCCQGQGRQRTARNLPIEIRQVWCPPAHCRRVTPPGHRRSSMRTSQLHRVHLRVACHPSRGEVRLHGLSSGRAPRSTSKRQRRKTTLGLPAALMKFTKPPARRHDPRARQGLGGEKCSHATIRTKGLQRCHKLNGKGGQLDWRSITKASRPNIVCARESQGIADQLELVRGARDPAGIVAGSLMPMPALSRQQWKHSRRAISATARLPRNSGTR